MAQMKRGCKALGGTVQLRLSSGFGNLAISRMATQNDDAIKRATFKDWHVKAVFKKLKLDI